MVGWGRDELPRARAGMWFASQQVTSRRQRHACRRDELQSFGPPANTPTAGWMSAGWRLSIQRHRLLHTSTAVATPPARLTRRRWASTDFDYAPTSATTARNLDFLAPAAAASRESPPPTARHGTAIIRSPAQTVILAGFHGTSARAHRRPAWRAPAFLSTRPSPRGSSHHHAPQFDKSAASLRQRLPSGLRLGRVNAFRALTNAYADLQLAIRSEPNPAVVSSNLVYSSRFPMPGRPAPPAFP